PQRERRVDLALEPLEPRETLGAARRDGRPPLGPDRLAGLDRVVPATRSLDTETARVLRIDHRRRDRPGLEILERAHHGSPGHACQPGASSSNGSGASGVSGSAPTTSSRAGFDFAPPSAARLRRCHCRWTSSTYSFELRIPFTGSPHPHLHFFTALLSVTA